MNREWRLTAVFCMQYVLGFEDQIVEALHDSDADIRPSIYPRKELSLLSPLCDSEDAQIAEASREAVLMAKGAVEHGLDEDFDDDTEPEEPW